MSTAFLFPGQGSQTPKMLHSLPDHPEVTRTLDEISEVLGDDVRSLDSEERLQSTVASQLALLAAGVATARALLATGVAPRMVGGLSAGAFGAAVIANVLELKDAVRLVKLRAERMQGMYASGYGMAAILGLLEGEVAALVARVSTDAEPVYVGNINAPRQVVIGGADAGVDRVIEAALTMGARRAQRLAVPVVSHCALLEPVAVALRESVAKIELHPPMLWYIGNVHARRLFSAGSIVEDLASNIAHGVRWHDMTTLMVELGCNCFLEMPPGTVLSTLAEQAFPSATIIPMAETALQSAEARWRRVDGEA